MSEQKNTTEEPGGGSALNVQLCRVAWRGKITGFTGRGSPVTYEIADAAVKDANRRIREIEHWIEIV
ncbi:MAG: hypothetical protein WC216_11135 [Gallionella sp.]